MISITIFTPTYNRAHLLERLYQSLCEQCVDLDLDFDSPLCIPYKGEDVVSAYGFEWLVVDDGSIDNTEELVQGFIEEKKISIRYFKKQNGGKHTAINMGVELAKGELFFIADSDDYLPKDALQVVMEEYQKVKDDATLGGVAGLDKYADGRIVGSGLPCDSIDCNAMEIRYKYHVTGDMKEVFRTEALKEFPFPEIEGERFCSEQLVWFRIAQKYKLHYFNKPIYIAEYQEGGITSGITLARMKSPIATMMCYAELYGYDVPCGQKVKAAINFWRFAFCAKNREVKIKGWGNLLAPIGYLVFLNDKRKIKL